MKVLGNLIQFELKRAKTAYLILFFSVFILELFIIGVKLIRTKLNLNLPPFFDIYSSIFHSSILLVVGGAMLTVCVFCMITWLREWQLQGSFIYRLLMLPVKRMKIYWAKLISIWMMMTGLLGLQLFIFWVVSWLVKWLFTNNQIMVADHWFEFVLTDGSLWSMIFPSTIWMGMLAYGFIFVSMLTFFNLFLIWAGYRNQGNLILLGMYVLFAVLLTGYLYLYGWLSLAFVWSLKEIVIYSGIALLLYGMVQVFFAVHVMNHKISV